ncbi:hypothetical protein ACFFX0_25510 [Citricoccus parietis]|uniref:Uncharacterized protein n=1 Tax=Citricoccus parietis TaxID=592307 RepID=A0ABV5G7G7_9MICC
MAGLGTLRSVLLGGVEGSVSGVVVAGGVVLLGGGFTQGGLGVVLPGHGPPHEHVGGRRATGCRVGVVLGELVVPGGRVGLDPVQPSVELPVNPCHEVGGDLSLALRLALRNGERRVLGAWGAAGQDLRHGILGLGVAVVVDGGVGLDQLGPGGGIGQPGHGLGVIAVVVQYPLVGPGGAGGPVQVVEFVHHPAQVVGPGPLLVADLVGGVLGGLALQDALEDGHRTLGRWGLGE